MRGLWFICVVAVAASGQTPGVERHFVAAQQAQTSQDYATAEREYEAVLQLKPSFAEAHMNLGLVYESEQRPDDAAREFRSALQYKPELAGANFFLGVYECKRGEGAAAVRHLQTAAHAAPKQTSIWLWLATACGLTGRGDGQIDALQHAVALEPANIDALYLLGQAYERQGKAEVAFIKASRNSALGEQMVAESYAKSNEWPSAVIHFQNAIAKAPGAARLHVELGEVYLHAGKLKLAQSEFEADLRVDPQSLRALVRLGEVQLLTGDVDRGLASWAECLKRDSRQTELILGLRETPFGDATLEQIPQDVTLPDIDGRSGPAVILAQKFIAKQRGMLSTQVDEHAAAVVSKTDLKTAEKLADESEYDEALKALRGLPESDAVRYWRAQCYEKLATAAYFNLYRADPDSYRVHQLLGDLASTREDNGTAMQEYRKAISLKPDTVNLHYSLGHVLWKDSKVDESRAEYEAELKLDPAHSGALHELATTYLYTHQPETALPYLKQALAGDPNNPDIHRDLGTAYMQLKDLKNAEAEYKVALAGDHDGSVHYQLARVYQALGEKQDADREFTTYRAMNEAAHQKLEANGDRLNQINKTAE